MPSSQNIGLREYLDERFRNVLSGIDDIRRQVARQSEINAVLTREVTEIKSELRQTKRELKEHKANWGKTVWFVVSAATGMVAYLLIQLIAALQ